MFVDTPNCITACMFFFLESQNVSITFMIQTQGFNYNLLIYPISYKKNYPHPNSIGCMGRKKYMKMFPFCSRDPWSIQPTTC